MATSDDEPEWGDLKPVPMRVLVKGASSAVWVSPPGGSQTRQTFPWWLEALLTSAGMPNEVRNRAQEAQKITKALCDWDTEVQTWGPDVVILNYGIFESLPGILPRWMERLATGWHRHPGPIRIRFRRRVITPIWYRLVKIQRRLDERLNPGPYRVKPERVIRELARLVEQIKIVGNPLVLVMDPWPPAAKWRSWFPGLEVRSSQLREDVRAWLANNPDPDVRLFPLSDILYRQPDLNAAMPDGIHYSAKVHREIAEELATEILAWSRNQPHLQWPDVDADRYRPRPRAARRSRANATRA